MKEYIIEFLKLKTKEIAKGLSIILASFVISSLVMIITVGICTIIEYTIYLTMPYLFTQLAIPKYKFLEDRFLSECIQTGLIIVFLIGCLSASIYGLTLMLLKIVISIKENWSLAKSNVNIRREIAHAKN